MKVGFTGTQQGMNNVQKMNVMSFLNTYGNQITEVHHGDCIGADVDFHNLTEKTNIEIIIHPPKYNSKRAFCTSKNILPIKDYLDRNHDIVDATGILLVTPSDMTEKLRSGTWATYRYAKKKNKKIVVFLPDGKIDIQINKK